MLKEISEKRKNKITYFCFIFFFWVLSWLRWERGTDWSTYLMIFKSSNIFSPSNLEYLNLEYGYRIINFLIRSFTDNFTVFLMITSFFAYYFTNKYIKKFSPYPVMSLFLLWGICLGNVFFVRQTIAISILLFSMIFIIRRQRKIFYLFVVLATLFHNSAFLFIFAYDIFYLRLKKRHIFYSLFFVISIYIFKSFFIQLLSSFGSFLWGSVAYRLELYFADGIKMYGSSYSYATVLLKGLTEKIFFLFIFYFIFSKKIKNDLLLKGFVNLYCFGCIIYALMIQISLSFARISIPYHLSLIIILPLLYSKIKGKQIKYLFILILIIYVLFKLFISLNSYWDLFVPYNTIFNKDANLPVY